MSTISMVFSQKGFDLELSEIDIDPSINDDKLPVRPNVYKLCEVEICAHGDDWPRLDLSTDGGKTYPYEPLAQIQPPQGWSNSLTYTYSGAPYLTINTRFQFTIVESGYVIIRCIQ